MMRNTTLLCCLAAVITVSLFTSCDKSESFSPDITPESPVYTMTVKAGKVATKALALGEHSSISATWTEGDIIEVWTADGTTTKYGTLTAESGGTASTTFTGELDAAPQNGEELLLKYGSPDYASQDGTLTGNAKSIDKICDYALATVTATVSGTTVITTDADFVSQQAIVRLQLYRKNDGAALVAKKIILQFGGTTCTITPSSPTDFYYVAIPCGDDANVWTDFAISVSEEGTAAWYEMNASMPLVRGQYFTAQASPAQLTLSRIKSRINKGTDCRKYVGWEVYPSGTIAPKGANPAVRIGYIAYVSSSAVDHDFPDSRIFVLASSDVSYGGTDNFIWGHSDSNEYRDIAVGRHKINPYDYPYYPYTDDYGYDNTNILQDYGFDAHPAAYVAWNYGAERPEGASHWFLPACMQFKRLVGGEGTSITNKYDFFDKMDFNLKHDYAQNDDGYWTSSESVSDNPTYQGYAFYLSTSTSIYWDVYEGPKDQTSAYRFVRAAFVY